MSPADWLTVAGFRLAWWAGRNLPRSVVVTFFVKFADAMFRRNGVSVQRLKFNLARVTGMQVSDQDLIDLAKRNLRNYFRYWAEMFCLTKLSNAETFQAVVFENLGEVDRILASGRGVLAVATHSGNWDLAGAAMAHHIGRLTTVAEKLKPTELFDEFVAARTPRGIEILPHRGGPVPPIEILRERLQSGNLVALAADRDMSRHGVEVQFFGHLAKMPAGPALLSSETGAALIPVQIWFEGRITRIKFMSEIATAGKTVPEVTQDMAHAFEQNLTAHPDNWFMLQQVWLDHPVAYGGRA